jgi:hypothetical protein
MTQLEKEMKAMGISPSEFDQILTDEILDEVVVMDEDEDDE